MKRTIPYLPFLIIAGAIMIAVACTAHAQPKGWACDYGYRPGNTWFYRSTVFQGRIYSESVLRDSIGADGTYWVYFDSPTLQFSCWYRIDSVTCDFDQFYNPNWSQFQHWFVPHADSGDLWVVDSISATTPLHARIDNIYTRKVFGQTVRSKDVVFYPAGQSGETWYHSQEWAEGIGIIRKQSHPNGYDEIVGAIIDGVHYGNTTGVETVTEASESIAVYPIPTSSAATVKIASRGGHRADIRICDLLGRSVQYRELNVSPDGMTTTTLDVSGFAPGTYLIAVTIDGTVHSTRLIVAR